MNRESYACAHAHVCIHRACVRACMHTCVPVYASAHTDVNVTARQRNPMPHAAPALRCLMFILGRWSPFSTTHDAIPSPFLPRVFPFCPTFTAPSAPESFCFPAHICVCMPASASAYPPLPCPNHHHTHTHVRTETVCLPTISQPCPRTFLQTTPSSSSTNCQRRKAPYMSGMVPNSQKSSI